MYIPKYVFTSFFISFVCQAILNHGCISSKLMLSDLCNVGPMITLPYKQPVGPKRPTLQFDSGPTLCSQRWPNENENVGQMMALPQLCDKQHWPNVSPTCLANDGPQFSQTVGQRCATCATNVGPTKLTTLPQRWPKCIMLSGQFV